MSNTSKIKPINGLGEETTRGNGLIQLARTIHSQVFFSLERRLDSWFVGLAMRLAFLGVLFPYYLNSAVTKLGDGVFGFLAPSANAFAQILPPIAEEYVYDTTAIPFFPWHLIVIAGTVAELTCPLLLILGLFTRWMALGLIIFIAVQTYVDIAFFDAQTGALLNGQPDNLIDQRLLWLLPLIYLVIKGPGTLSLDRLLGGSKDQFGR